MKFWKLAATALVLSTSVNASTLNTLNGVDYEWLELTATVGMSRDQVEAGILAATEGDALYGYEYASRQLLEDLLLSYASFDGLDGIHGAPQVVSGIEAMMLDFGVTEYGVPMEYYSTYETVDGYTVTIDSGDYVRSLGMYGLTDECRDSTVTCIATLRSYVDSNGDAISGMQFAEAGWDANSADFVLRSMDGSDINEGSFIVRPQVVPVPAAVWLLSSGLIGLIGIARRKV